MLEQLNIDVDTGEFTIYNGVYESRNQISTPLTLSSSKVQTSVREPIMSVRVINRTAMALQVMDMSNMSMTEPAMPNGDVKCNSFNTEMESVSFLVSYTYPTLIALGNEIKKLESVLSVIGILKPTQELLLKAGKEYLRNNRHEPNFKAVVLTIERVLSVADFFTESMVMSRMVEMCVNNRSKALIISEYGYMLYLGAFQPELTFPDLSISMGRFITKDFKEEGAFVKIVIVDNSNKVPPHYIKLGPDVISIPIITDKTLKEGVHYVTKKDNIPTTQCFTLEKATELMNLGTNKTLVERGVDITHLKEVITTDKLLQQAEVQKLSIELEKNKHNYDKESLTLRQEAERIKLESVKEVEQLKQKIERIKLESVKETERLKQTSEQDKHEFFKESEKIKQENERIKQESEKIKADNANKRAESDSKRHSAESISSIFKAVVGTIGTCAAAYLLYNRTTST